MIIKLERYNEIGELFILKGTTGSQGHIFNQNRGQRVSVLRIQVSVQILVPLIFYSSQFILLIFIHACICSQLVFVVTVVML